MRQPDMQKIIFCYCPTALAEHIWAVTDMLLADRIENDQVAACLKCFSPPIRKAHSIYSHLSQQHDKPLSKFSDTCSIDPVNGTWVSSVITLYPVLAGAPGGNSGTVSAPTSTISAIHSDDSAPPASSERGTVSPNSGTDTSNPTSGVANVTVESESTVTDALTSATAAQNSKPADQVATSPSAPATTSSKAIIRPSPVQRIMTLLASRNDASDGRQSSGPDSVPPDVAAPSSVPPESIPGHVMNPGPDKDESRHESSSSTSLLDDPETGHELPSIPGVSSVIHEDSEDQSFQTETSVPPSGGDNDNGVTDTLHRDTGIDDGIDQLYEPSSTSLGRHAEELPTNAFVVVWSSS